MGKECVYKLFYIKFKCLLTSVIALLAINSSEGLIYHFLCALSNKSNMLYTVIMQNSLSLNAFEEIYFCDEPQYTTAMNHNIKYI